jgi:hypothetical protein
MPAASPMKRLGEIVLESKHQDLICAGIPSFELCSYALNCGGKFRDMLPHFMWLTLADRN